jgi:NAD(P)-dependent dehydrogenase (short-subunit alcohol dehydrogenase family)
VLPRIDVLVHNAGYACQKRKVSKDGFERTKQINFLGPFLLTRLLWGLLLKGSDVRVISVNSLAHRLTAGDLSFRPVELGLKDFHLEKRRYNGMSCYS